MNDPFLELKTRLAEIHDLSKAVGMLAWDMETMMPPGGGPVRAQQMAAVSKVAHEKFTDASIGRLLDALRSHESSLPYDSDDAALIRVSRRDYEKAVRVPSELQAEMTRSASIARMAWAEARARSDFALFLPHLQRNLDLKLRYVECFLPAEEPYDIVLDDFEPGMKTAEVRSVFAALKKELVPLIARIRAHQDAVSDAPLHGHFPAERQPEFCWSLVERLGANRESWRLDPTAHPFATNSGTQDVRLTTRYYEHYLSAALFGTMHEFGHGLYEHQIAPELERTPLCHGASLGLHESQSRLWENLVGRSREFWQFMYPSLARTFREALAGVDVESFYRAANKVQPSLIRVEADEATYSLHIILRFELEQDMLQGRVALEDLPAIWNARIKDYLGVEVPDDAQGVLQDVHWSGGMLGYFPTYALGSIQSAQIWERAMADLPDLPERIARGDFAPLRTWLGEKLHRHGRKFTPKEMIERITGGPIRIEPFMKYLTGKFTDLYGLT
jgi:carboxypeptidase Taq